MGKAPKAADEKRSRTMSRIKGADTSIELKLRSALWHSGFRYRKNCRHLPGSPDIALTKHRIAIFCDGEFWHGKGWSFKKRRIKHNRRYWIKKIERNIARDSKVNLELSSLGWTVIRFWGNEIDFDVSACVDAIREIILRARMDELDEPDVYEIFDDPEGYD